jgi:hypothetical protein
MLQARYRQTSLQKAKNMPKDQSLLLQNILISYKIIGN